MGRRLVRRKHRSVAQQSAKHEKLGEVSTLLCVSCGDCAHEPHEGSLSRPLAGNGAMPKVKLEPSHVQWNVINTCTAAHQPQHPHRGPGRARMRESEGRRAPGVRNGRTCHRLPPPLPWLPDRSGGLACTSSGPHAYSASILQIWRGASRALPSYSPAPICRPRFRQGQRAWCAHGRRTGVGHTATLRRSSYQKAVGARDRGGD